MVAPNSPVADWIARPTGDHSGTFVNLVNGATATISRAGVKTVYDPSTGRIYDVAANTLPVLPWSAYKTGGKGYCAIIEESRVNSLLNSYFGNGVTSWDFYANLLVENAALATTLYGANPLMDVKMTGQSGVSAYAGMSQSAAAVAGESWTFSTYIDVTEITAGMTAQLALQAYNAGGTELGAQVLALTPNTGVVRRTVSYPSLPANTATVTAKIRTSGNMANGKVLRVTLGPCQLEKGAFVTSYIPTTTGAVTRNADQVTIPTTGWPTAAGTIVGVAHEGAPSSTAPYLAFWSNTDASDRMTLYRYTAAYAEGRVDGTTRTSSSTLAYPQTNPFVLACKWVGGGAVTAYANGTPGTPSANLTGTPDAMLATANVGRQVASAYYGGPIHRLIVYGTALDNAVLASAEMTTGLALGPRSGMLAKLMAIGVL